MKFNSATSPRIFLRLHAQDRDMALSSFIIGVLQIELLGLNEEQIVLAAYADKNNQKFNQSNKKN